MIFGSPKQHEKNFFLQFLFFVNFYRCKKSTISYKIVFFFLNCSGGGQKTPKTRFFVKNEFFGRHPNNLKKKNYFIAYSTLLTPIKVYKKKNCKKKKFSCCLGDPKITKIHFFETLSSCNSKSKGQIKKS